MSDDAPPPPDRPLDAFFGGREARDRYQYNQWHKTVLQRIPGVCQRMRDLDLDEVGVVLADARALAGPGPLFEAIGTDWRGNNRHTLMSWQASPINGYELAAVVVCALWLRAGESHVEAAELLEEWPEIRYLTSAKQQEMINLASELRADSAADLQRARDRLDRLRVVGTKTEERPLWAKLMVEQLDRMVRDLRGEQTRHKFIGGPLDGNEHYFCWGHHLNHHMGHAQWAAYRGLTIGKRAGDAVFVGYATSEKGARSLVKSDEEKNPRREI